jgi:hypothetical protein
MRTPAVAARGSTDQAGTADKSESVERPLAHARAYVARKGWTVSEAHVYADDGPSVAPNLASAGQAWRAC